jgi:biotin carboxylase
VNKQPLHILCISSFFKGERFLEASKALGNKVYLVTSEKLRHEAWPWEAIDEVFYMAEENQGKWNLKHLIGGIAYQMRQTKFDAVVALDDFDVEKAAHVREHFRIGGMGETTVRYFRDKLAMRMKAQEEGVDVPAFTGLFHDADIAAYTQNVPAPWMIKPRFAASATGITKVYSVEELWYHLEELGEERHNYLLERFSPGDVYHVDTLNVDGKVVFSRASQYLDTPFEVAHGGGIFRSMTVDFSSEEAEALRQHNEKVLQAFGMKHGASHSEFIKDRENGKYYFLETSYRVGGANLAEMVEASSGINLWQEWARIEDALRRGEEYQLPAVRHDYGGIVVSLSRYLHPDTSSFADEEICWRMHKDWHIGLIVNSPDQERVRNLLDHYTQRIGAEFHASLPAPAKPTNF